MFNSQKSRPPKISVVQHNPQVQRDRLGNLLEDVARNRQNSPRNRWLWIVVGLAVLLVITVGFLFVRSQVQLRKLQNDLKEQTEQNQNNPAVKSAEENKQLIEQIRKLIILPEDEEPTIATVNDLSKLQNQPFFANAQIGDKVLIYNKAKKAILFRPSENKIIELAPLIDNSSAATAPSSNSNQTTSSPAQ